MSGARVWLAAGFALVALAGCGRPTTGTAVPAEGVRATATDDAPAPDPENVRWMNRFCGVGKLLITAGETMQAPATSSDAAVLKRQFLDTTGRLIGVLDAVLSDLRALRPPPAPEIDPLLGTLVDGLDESRGIIDAARSDVEASEPMTVAVYAAALDRFGTGMRGFESALTAMNNLELPGELLDAGESAPNCADEDAPPTTTR